MSSKKVILNIIASLGLISGMASGAAIAQMTHEKPTSEKLQTTQFQHIKQPLWIKSAVTVGSLSLIGLELWWFLLSLNRHSSHTVFEKSVWEECRVKTKRPSVYSIRRIERLEGS